MSHFLVVTIIEPPDHGELVTAGIRGEMKAAAQVEPTMFGSITLSGDVPIHGEAKALRTYAEERVGELLAPYDENAETEEYETDCHCIGDVAEIEVRERIERERPDLDVGAARRRAQAVRHLTYCFEPDNPDRDTTREGLLGGDDVERDVDPAETRRILLELDAGAIVDAVRDRWPEVVHDQAVVARVKALEAEDGARWKAMWEERKALEAAYKAEHPMGGQPDPTCGWVNYRFLGFRTLRDRNVSHEALREGYEREKSKAEAELQEARASSDADEPLFSKVRDRERWLDYVEEAWAVLGDSERRAAYDVTGHVYDDGSTTDGCLGTGRVKSQSNPRGYWDWWVVGGRWAGVFRPDYDSNMDPRNQERCTICGGTGRRADANRFGEEWVKSTGGCNGCQGSGVARRWHNAEFDGDVVSVDEYLALLRRKGEGKSRHDDERFGIPYALVTPDGEWHSQGKMGWFGGSSDALTDQQWYERCVELVSAHAGRVAGAEDTAAVVDAQRAYARDEIDEDELERRLDNALGTGYLAVAVDAHV